MPLEGGDQRLKTRILILLRTNDRLQFRTVVRQFIRHTRSHNKTRAE